MRGNELREWRQRLGWTQSDLMEELEISSRQTLSSWENAEEIPRLVELAIIALDQVEACRKRGGFESQWTPAIIAHRRGEKRREIFEKGSE